jgi:hypothetical protein
VATDTVDIPDPPDQDGAPDADVQTPIPPWPSWTSTDRYRAALRHARRVGVTEADLDDLWQDLGTPYKLSPMAALARQVVLLAVLLGVGTLIGQTLPTIIRHPSVRTLPHLDHQAVQLMVGSAIVAAGAAVFWYVATVVENRLRVRAGRQPRVRGPRPPWKTLRLSVWFCLVHAAEIAAASAHRVRPADRTVRLARRLRNAAATVDTDLAASLRLPRPHGPEVHTAAALAQHLRDLADQIVGPDLERAAEVADRLAELLPLTCTEVGWLGFDNDGTTAPGVSSWRRHRRVFEWGAAGVLLAATVVLSLTHLQAASIVCAVLSAAVAGGRPAVDSIAQTWSRPPAPAPEDTNSSR